MTSIPNKFLLVLALVLSSVLTSALASCRPTLLSGETTPAITRPATSVPTPTQTPTPTRTLTTKPTRTSPPAPSPTANPVCSPLEDITLEELAGIVVNPFAPPRPGSDQPHQGLDLADLQPGSRLALAGKPVSAVVAGTVRAVISDRFPYGNAVILETTRDMLPPGWEAYLDSPGANQTPDPALTCPPYALPDDWADRPASLYLLYAHLASLNSLAPGDLIACGQRLGTVGDTGNALHPHLHLESRAGPAGAAFPSLAHYDASAIPEEMGAYCLWRVSGWFPLVDPNRLLNIPAP